jgi:ABC-type multidrug transport system fused ATPase/permease subunit
MWKKYRNAFDLLCFYSEGLKIRISGLFIFSILLGLLETFQLVLLYPILSTSMGIQDSGSTVFEPFYIFISQCFDLPTIVVYTLLFIIVVILSFVVTLIYRLLSLQLTKAVIIGKKGAIFDKLMASDYRYYVNHKQGDILYIVVTAPGRVREFLELGTMAASDIIIILTIIVMLFFFSPSGTLLLLGISIFFIILVHFIGTHVSYKIGSFQIRSMQSENKVVTDYVQGIRQIRSVFGDCFWKKEYDRSLHVYWNNFVKYRFTEFLPGAAIQFVLLTMVGVAVLVLYYFYVEKFVFLIPLMGTFVFSALKILPKLSTSGTSIMKMMDAYPNLEQIYHFLREPQYSLIKNGTTAFETLKADIIFEDVSFAYDRDQKLIEGLNITIQKNRITALVGLSGSGKSTVISLLLRYYDVTSGRILINGIDLRDYDKKTFLEKVGYVSQDTFIYNTTIRDNISFGRVFSDDAIIEAAIKANIHEFISRLPNGYETPVGDHGITLSGGEKQRIAIARALIREPVILVLDEATSSLDNEAESFVQESINTISKNITTFVVAHRLSTIRMADKIYVMDNGIIIESGGHDELMNMKGRYFGLFESGTYRE